METNAHGRNENRECPRTSSARTARHFGRRRTPPSTQDDKDHHATETREEPPQVVHHNPLLAEGSPEHRSGHEVDAVHRGGLTNEVATGSARHHHNPGSPGQRAPARGEGEQVSTRHRAALATLRSCGRSEKAMAHGPTRIGSRPTMGKAQGSIGRDIGCNADNPQRTR